MTPMHALSITALVIAAHVLVMPSCVQWNIGENIRECAETHIGINPAEAYLVGEAQRTPSTRTPEEVAAIGSRHDGRVCIAREARYEVDTPLVNGGFFPAAARAQNIRLTDAYRRVSFSGNKVIGLMSIVGECYDPEGQKMEPYRKRRSVSLNARTMGSAEVERSAWYPLAVTVAAPFDYIIDPALTVVSAPAAGLGMAAACCYFEVKSWWSYREFQQNRHATPAP